MEPVRPEWVEPMRPDEWVEPVSGEPASPGLREEEEEEEEVVITVVVGCEEEEGSRREPDMEDNMGGGGGCGCWGCNSGVDVKDGALGYRFPMS